LRWTAATMLCAAVLPPVTVAGDRGDAAE